MEPYLLRSNLVLTMRSDFQVNDGSICGSLIRVWDSDLTSQGIVWWNNDSAADVPLTHRSEDRRDETKTILELRQGIDKYPEPLRLLSLQNELTFYTVQTQNRIEDFYYHQFKADRRLMVPYSGGVGRAQ